MPRKAKESTDKERGCCLEAVKQFLQSGTIPEGYSKNDKRALRRRAKSFVLIAEDLYFTDGRSRHNKGLIHKIAGDENPENEPDHTQVLRKVVFSEEEQQNIIDEAHIDEDGSHHGMERTIEQVSSRYYWLGIVYGVRRTIYNCLSCHSRFKKPGDSHKFHADLEADASSGSFYATAASTSSSKSKSSNFPKAQGDELASEDADGADDVDDNAGDDGLSEFSGILTESHSVKQEVEAEPPDVFTVTKEICNRFWQKVEIQLFGPYQAGKKMIYVAVALDSYSQFPEAVTMEVLSPATLTNFFLNLFCRHGAMEKVLLLQNQVTKNKDLFINLQDLLHAGLSPALLFPQVNPLDERWHHIEKSLARFVGLYPDFWFHCLEAFMVPLRITLPPEAVYTPYYLVYGRDAPMPDKVNQLYNVNPSTHGEVQLTEDQEKQTVEMVTAAYGIYTDNPSITATLPEHPSIPATLPEHPSIPATLPEPSGEKHPVSCPVKEPTWIDDGSTQQQQQQQQRKPHRHKDVKRTRGFKRRQGRSRVEERDAESGGQMGDMAEVAQTKLDVGNVTGHPIEAGIDVDDDSNKDIAYQPEIKSVQEQSPPLQPIRSSGRKRKATKKAVESGIFTKKPTNSLFIDTPTRSSKKVLASVEKRGTQVVLPDQATQPSKTKGLVPSCEAPLKRSGQDLGKTVLPKKKRGRPCKDIGKDDMESPTFTGIKSGSREGQERRYSSVIKNMQQFSWDTFYFIIKQFLESCAIPPGVPDNTKQLIRRLCTMFHLKDGKLYSNSGKSAGRQVVLREKARFSLLRKAHARGEVHHGRKSVLKFLSDLNVFWNGMSLDVDAFLHCCPECIEHNPLGSLPQVTIASKSQELTAGGERGEDQPHLSEDEEEEFNYEELTQFLTEDTVPAAFTAHQQQRIKERSASFTVMDGSLHYHTQGRKDPVPVLLSDTAKQAAIQEAHVENGVHLSPQDTQARLRGSYFWRSMTWDVMRQVLHCCGQDALAREPVLHRNPLIQERVTKMRAYYMGNIPKLDTSALIASEMESRQAEELRSERKERRHDGESQSSIDSKQDPRSSAVDAAKMHNENKVVASVVESIIKDIGKSMIGDKVVQSEGNSEVKIVPQSPLSGRSRKDAHTCQYCGKFISGNIKYRIHLYKHTGVKPFTCSTCGKSFTTRKSLQVHIRKHTGLKPYLCNQCGREFSRPTSFKYHLKTHNKVQTKPLLPCSECSRSFRSQNRLDKHKQFKHAAQPKTYMCEHCGKVFLHSKSMKSHEQSHCLKHSCRTCKADFSDQEQLESHLKEAHSDDVKAEAPSSSQSGSALAQPQVQVQQQFLPHIVYTSPQTQLVQTIDLSTGNISQIQLMEEEQQQQPPRQIIITEQPSGQITISEHPGTIIEGVSSHIAVAQQVEGGVIISRQGADHITVSQQAGAHIRIVEDNLGARIALDTQPVSENRTEMKPESGAYISHTPPFSQPVHSTAHILTLSTSEQNPVPSSSSSSATSSTLLQPLHGLQSSIGEDSLLQQESGPVQYEVECLSDPNLTEADLSAVHLLAQASLAGQNLAL